MAEAVTGELLVRAGLDDRVTVESFGTAGYHVGEGADPSALAALARHGWPRPDHRARQITHADLDRLDLVLCADQANRRDVLARTGGSPVADIRLLRSYDGDAEPGAGVPDPWGQDDAGFDRCLDVIEQACRGLVAELAAGAH